MPTARHLLGRGERDAQGGPAGRAESHTVVRCYIEKHYVAMPYTYTTKTVAITPKLVYPAIEDPQGRTMSPTKKTIEALTGREYRYGFVSPVEADMLPPGLDEGVIRLISAKKNEPAFMLDWRLRALRHWQALERSEAQPPLADIPDAPVDHPKTQHHSPPN